MARDDFTKDVIDRLRSRAANRCSNPKCRVPTTAASEEDTSKINNIGIAAHICAASPRGPRYSGALTAGERKSVDNGIWLCSNCAADIDRDVKHYTISLLREWKREAERMAREELGKKLPARRDVIDTVAAALTGLPNVFVPCAISNVHEASQKVLEALDDRFTVKSSYTDEGTKFDVYAKENVNVSVHVNPEYRKEFAHKHKRLIEYGEDLEICAGAIRFDGSRLFEEIAGLFSSGKLVLSKSRTAGLQKLSVVDSATSSTEQFDDIKGEITFGSELLTFRGGCFNEMLTLSFRAMKDSLKTQFNITVDFANWENRDVRFLPYFTKLYALFDKLAKGWKLCTSLEINGHQVLQTKNLVENDFVRSTALWLRYIDKATALLRYLNCDVKYVSDFSFTLEEFQSLGEAVRISEGQCVYTRNQVNSNPSCSLTVSDDATNIRLLKNHHETPMDITVTMSDGDNISLFGQTIHLPRKALILRSVIPKLDFSATDAKAGDIVQVEWLPAEGFECRIEFIDS